MIPVERSSPVVFISYSHDSQVHKQWVLEFASQLVANGVEVILDQWDLELGDDLPKFMEKSVTTADRVLMICTESYVHKADDGRGGVGYEAMVVTGELIQNLGTNKFIPITRQDGGHAVPVSVNTRYFVDLNSNNSADYYEEQFSKLVAALHNVQTSKKPSLGRSPFQPPIPTAAVANSNDELGDVDLDSAEKIYRVSSGIARSRNHYDWRKLIATLHNRVSEQLQTWSSDPKSSQCPPQNVLDTIPLFAAIFHPLIVPALVGVESMEDGFKDQTGILDDLINPHNWNRSGLVVVTELPSAVGFIYQALHGALAVDTSQLFLAFELADQKVASVDGTRRRLWQTSGLVGWPKSLNGKSDLAWNVLMDLYEKWPWLRYFFNSEQQFRANISAYYMALHIRELVENIILGRLQDCSAGRYVPDIPLRFQFEDTQVGKVAYKKLLKLKNQFRADWKTRGIKENDLMDAWPKWMDISRNLCAQTAPLMFYTGDMFHVNFFDDIQ